MSLETGKKIIWRNFDRFVKTNEQKVAIVEMQFTYMSLPAILKYAQSARASALLRTLV
jgi:hypothetical protein